MKFSSKAWDRVQNAVLATECDPQGKEQAVEMAGAFIDKFLPEAEPEEILAVESPFAVKLDPKAYIVGVRDLLSRTPRDGKLLVSDWKTTKAPDPPRHTEDKWRSRTAVSIQFPTYAWATADEYDETPEVRVRAITKSSPVRFWPSVNRGFLTFSPDALHQIHSAYEIVVNSIRWLRRSIHTLTDGPWQHTGSWCFHQYGRDCIFLPDCLQGNAAGNDQAEGWTSEDPGITAFLQQKGISAKLLRDPDFVILSASSYETWGVCPEKFRRERSSGGDGVEGEDALARQTGTAFHAGIAEFYRLIQERQRKK